MLEPIITLHICVRGTVHMGYVLYRALDGNLWRMYHRVTVVVLCPCVYLTSTVLAATYLVFRPLLHVVVNVFLVTPEPQITKAGGGLSLFIIPLLHYIPNSNLLF